LFIASLVHGQDRTLTVVDAARQYPLPGVVVFLNHQPVGVTDLEGKWRMTSAEHAIHLDQQTWQVQLLGYRDTSWVWPQTEMQYTMAIWPRDYEGSALLVSASMSGQGLRTATQSYEVLDGRDITRKRTSDAATALERVPGITIIDGQASVRGGSGYAYGAGSRVLLVVDDQPLMTPDRSDVKWNFVPMELVDRMEVAKGASSVQYGSSALNGVVNIKTIQPGMKSRVFVQTYYTGYRKPQDPTMSWWSGHPYQGRHSTDMLEHYPMQTGLLAHVGEGVKHEKFNFSWILGAHMHGGDGWIQSEKERRARLSFKTKFTFKKKERLQVGLDGVLFRQNMTQALFWANDSTGAFLPNSPTATVNYNDLWLTVDPWAKYSDKKGNLHEFKTRYFASYFPSTKHIASGLQLRHATYRFHRTTHWGLEYTAGLNYNYFQFGDDGLGGQHKGSFSGLFWQGEYDLKRWHFSLGGRMERFALDDHSVPAIPVWRGGLTYTLKQRHVFRFNYCQGYRFPSPAERYVKYTVDIISIYPNPDIIPERGWSSELGYKYLWEGESMQASWDVVVFLTRYRDLIEFTFGQWGTVNDPMIGLGYKSVNVSNAQIGGLETSSSINGKALGCEWHGLAGYTYLLPVDMDKFAQYAPNSSFAQVAWSGFQARDTAEYMLRYRFKHMIKANLDVTKGKWGCGLGWRYYSFMEKIDPVLELFIAGLSHYRELHPFPSQVWDARLFFQPNSNWNFSIQSSNVFNVFYTTRPAKPDAPQSFSFQLTYLLN
jgi:outer membrane receptor protein involved in Fe transport